MQDEQKKTTDSYKNIAAFIQGKIEAGEWSAGRKLPTQRALAEEFNVNRSTVIHALDILKDKGYIESKSGSGTFVSKHSSSDISRNMMNWNDYSKYSVYPTNHQTVRKINNLELDQSLIQLGKGELHTSLFPRDSFNKSLRTLENTFDNYGYNDGTGDDRFRQAISNYLKKRGISSSPQTILPVSGALQALQLITLGLLQRGSTVYAPHVSYIHSLHMFRTSGMRIKSVPFTSKALDADYLREHLSGNHHSSVLYINPTFHNPTTQTISSNNRKDLVEISNQYKMPIIEDDIFRDLWLDQEPHAPISSLDNSGHTLLIGSFSKTMAPTLRIGWISGPVDVIDKLSDLRMQLDYGTSYLPQLALYDFLESGRYEQHLLELREELRYRRDMLVHLLEENMDDYATWEVPNGGMFIWVLFSEEVNIRRLFTSLVGQGVLINPGFIYSSYPNQYVRLSFASSSVEEMRRGILIMRKVIEQHQMTVLE
ncbi:PLP-dependent aminotransferase family protein [Pontibacillus halophilus]|nr:PLP-dependent aminotransferase family protein [Pontibacillus halophilus]